MVRPGITYNFKNRIYTELEDLLKLKINSKVKIKTAYFLVIPYIHDHKRLLPDLSIATITSFLGVRLFSERG